MPKKFKFNIKPTEELSYLGITNEEADEITYGSKKKKKLNFKIKKKVIEELKKELSSAELKVRELKTRQRHIDIIEFGNNDDIDDLPEEEQAKYFDFLDEQRAEAKAELDEVEIELKKPFNINEILGQYPKEVKTLQQYMDVIKGRSTDEPIPFVIKTRFIQQNWDWVLEDSLAEPIDPEDFYFPQSFKAGSDDEAWKYDDMDMYFAIISSKHNNNCVVRNKDYPTENNKGSILLWEIITMPDLEQQHAFMSKENIEIEKKRIKVLMEQVNFFVDKCFTGEEQKIITLEVVHPHHNNLIMINPFRKEIEYYEPHGREYRGGTVGSKSQEFVNNLIEERFKAFVEKFNERNERAHGIFKAVSRAEICPRYTKGFQSAEGMYNAERGDNRREAIQEIIKKLNKGKITTDEKLNAMLAIQNNLKYSQEVSIDMDGYKVSIIDEGYCVAWSLLFMDSRLHFPLLSSQEIQESIMNIDGYAQLHQRYLPLMGFIRGLMLDFMKVKKEIYKRLKWSEEKISAHIFLSQIGNETDDKFMKSALTDSAKALSWDKPETKELKNMVVKALNTMGCVFKRKNFSMEYSVDALIKTNGCQGEYGKFLAMMINKISN